MSMPTGARVRERLGIRQDEARGLFWSFFYFFFLLCAYYVLRPMREARGLGVGVNRLPYLYTGTFLTMVLLAPIWSTLVSRLPLRRLLPWVYRFFGLNLLVFFAVFRSSHHWFPAAAFYVWVSVFNLMAVAVFWSFMADVWRTEQGKRLFGLITAGGSAGAVLGPLLTSLLVRPLGPELLLLVAAALLQVATFCLGRVARWHGEPRGEASPAAIDVDAPVGGGVFSGLAAVVRSPFLAAAAAYTLLSTFSGTFNYYLQARIVSAAGHEQIALTQLFARIDLSANLLIGVTQALAAGPLLIRFGVLPPLVMLPLISGAGFALCARWPVLVAVASLFVIRRGAAYGLVIPATGVLFTAVSREEKYKARTFIETVVYRGGDLTSAWVFTGLFEHGLGLSGLALVGTAIALPWTFLATFLGRRYARLAQTTTIGR